MVLALNETLTVNNISCVEYCFSCFVVPVFPKVCVLCVSDLHQGAERVQGVLQGPREDGRDGRQRRVAAHGGHRDVAAGTYEHSLLT